MKRKKANGIEETDRAKVFRYNFSNRENSIDYSQLNAFSYHRSLLWLWLLLMHMFAIHCSSEETQECAQYTEMLRTWGVVKCLFDCIAALLMVLLCRCCCYWSLTSFRHTWWKEIEYKTINISIEAYPFSNTMLLKNRFFHERKSRKKTGGKECLKLIASNALN